MFVVNKIRVKTIDNMREKCILLNDQPYVGYCTNVIFQQNYCPVETLEETKHFMGGKHGRYGYNSKVSVLPNGLATHSRK